jgi:hypothetical protein
MRIAGKVEGESEVQKWPIWTNREGWWTHAYIRHSGVRVYRVTSLIRKRTPPGPYRRPVPKVLRESKGGGHFTLGEVPLHS